MERWGQRRATHEPVTAENLQLRFGAGIRATLVNLSTAFHREVYWWSKLARPRQQTPRRTRARRRDREFEEARSWGRSIQT